MRQFARILKPLSLLMIVCVISSCDEIVNEILGEAVDCVFPLKPQLRARLDDGKQGEVYSGMITASVKNSTDEDGFDYALELLGYLPEGIQYTIFNRNIRLSGIPTESGDFRFTVEAEIYDNREESDDGICLGNNSVSKEYVLKIVP
jgi:hypothetical protein